MHLVYAQVGLDYQHSHHGEYHLISARKIYIFFSLFTTEYFNTMDYQKFISERSKAREPSASK